MMGKTHRYKCGVCGATVGAKVIRHVCTIAPRVTFTTTRPICDACGGDASDGGTFAPEGVPLPVCRRCLDAGYIEACMS